MRGRAEPGLTIDVLVQPRASRDAIGPMVGDRLKVAVAASPVDGAANAAVIATLAEALGVRKSAVEIVAGDRSRCKTVRIAGLTPAALAAALAHPMPSGARGG